MKDLKQKKYDPKAATGLQAIAEELLQYLWLHFQSESDTSAAELHETINIWAQVSLEEMISALGLLIEAGFVGSKKERYALTKLGKEEAKRLLAQMK